MWVLISILMLVSTLGKFCEIVIEQNGNYFDVKSPSSCFLVLWCADLISSICKCEKFCASHTRFCQALSFQNDSHSSPTWQSPISYTSRNLHCIALDPTHKAGISLTLREGFKNPVTENVRDGGGGTPLFRYLFSVNFLASRFLWWGGYPPFPLWKNLLKIGPKTVFFRQKTLFSAKKFQAAFHDVGGGTPLFCYGKICWKLAQNSVF